MLGKANEFLKPRIVDVQALTGKHTNDQSHKLSFSNFQFEKASQKLRWTLPMKVFNRFKIIKYSFSHYKTYL